MYEFRRYYFAFAFTISCMEKINYIAAFLQSTVYHIFDRKRRAHINKIKQYYNFWTACYTHSMQLLCNNLMGDINDSFAER